MCFNNSVRGEDLAPVYCILAPHPQVAKTAVRSKAVVLLLLLIHCFMSLTLVVGVLCWSLFCYAFPCVLSSFAIILARKRELVVLL